MIASEKMARRLHAAYEHRMMLKNLAPKTRWDDLDEASQKEFYTLTHHIETARLTHPDAPSWQIDYLCQAYGKPATEENKRYFRARMREAGK